MKKYLIIVAIIFLNKNVIVKAQNIQERTIYLNSSKINYKIISSINNTWGYDIFIDNKLKVHQPKIPCLNGNEGFKTKLAAENVAKIIISKIKKGGMPPEISIEEMKHINAI
ncbi:MAG: DUF4907 domain-containing protein [Bacteroidia bacterium]